MPIPLPQMSESEQPRTMCDEEAGFGALGTARGNLPLRAMDIQGRIDGLLSQVTVRQTFVNPFDEPVEATYIFPLPDRAGVHAFRMEVGGRTVEGTLEERAQARQSYQQALVAGQRAAIAEEERPGVFSLRVGNILPGEAATVHFEMTGVLPYAEGEVTFRFPLVVAPRYIPGTPLPGPSVGDGTSVDTDAVPDASRISPPVILPGFPHPVRLSLAIDLHEDHGCVARDGVRSSLHAVVAEANDGYRRIQLQPGERLDRDFILRFRLAGRDPENPIQSSFTVHPDSESGGQSGTFVLTLIPPSDDNDDETARRPRDVVFVLDRSGSMSGWKIVAARRALGRMIDTLGARDRFAVLAFDNSVETPPGLSQELVAASDRNRFTALGFLTKMEARGGTEMAAPLRMAAECLSGPDRAHWKKPAQTSNTRDAIIVLVTDGQVGNEDQILEALAPALAGIRVFALGIDRAVNAAFLARLADLGHGRCELVESEDRLDAVMVSMHRQIATPLLTDLALEPEGFAIEPDSLVPERLPDLFPGAPVLVLGRYQGQPAGRMLVKSRDMQGQEWCQSLDARWRDNPAIATAWARGQIRRLEDHYVVGNSDLEALERHILAVSLRYQVLSRFTAYVAIDRSEIANRGGKVHRITQPVEMPQGWDGAQHAYLTALDSSLMQGCASLDDLATMDSGLALMRLTADPPSLAAGGRRSKAIRHAITTRRAAAPPPPPPPSTDEPETLCMASEPTGLPARYELREQVDRGGQGMVFGAFDRDLQRKVCIRLVTVAANRVELLVGEARKLMALSHPSLVIPSDAGRWRDGLFLVTPSDRAGDGRYRVLPDRPPAPEESARWVAEIAEAVQYAFEQGFRRHDLLWTEVEIGPDGRAVLGGPMQWLRSTELDFAYGNPASLPPELIGGQALWGDPRCLVYSLGIVLYRLLTGTLPFAGGGPTVLQRIMKDAPRPPRTMNRSIPKELEAICLKAMARKPEDRHATPGALAQALRQFLAKETGPRKSFWKRK